jgi:hypothetical protein
MRTALRRYRRSRNPRLRRALLVAGLGLVACVAFEGAGSGRALALTESIREVPPIVGFMSGQVELSSDGGTTWATPPSESRVPRLSLIRTGSDGSCILVFEDNSLVAMRPGTTIQILPQAQELRLAVLSGEAWVRFDYVARNQRDGIGLPHATVSALEAGSFSFGASQDASVVKVLEGLVKVLPGGRGRASSGHSRSDLHGGLQRRPISGRLRCRSRENPVAVPPGASRAFCDHHYSRGYHHVPPAAA